MKVLIIAPYYAPYTEVPAIRVISLSKQLVDQGHEVTVYCYSRDMLKRITDESSLKAKSPEKVEIINFDIKKSKIPAFSDIMHGHYFLNSLKKNVDLNEYDIALCSLGPFYTLEATSYITKKIPYILDFRDLGAISVRPKRENVKEVKSPFMKVLKKVFYRMLFNRERKAVNCASTIVVVSQTDWDMMQKAYHIPENKMLLASNGYDEEKLKNLILREKDKDCIIGFVFGKFMYYSIERAVSLVKAVDTLRKQGYKAVSYTHLDVYKRQVYILPSIREGLNVSLMEALASGLPVVCGRIRGNVDLVEEENCLFDPMDEAGIRNTVEYAIANKAKLGQANLEKIKLFNLTTVKDLRCV